MFRGYTQQTVDFMWGIRFNNERGWFMDHKDVYQTELLEPTQALAEAVYEGLMEQLPHEPLMVKVSRIYRDARRLHGRGPYKDHLWFCIRTGDEDWTGKPTFYFEIAPEYYSYGMGCYDPTPLTMAKLRARIDRDPAPLEALARRLAGQEEFVLEGQTYKQPKGDPGPLLSPWYNRRQIGLSSDHNCEGVLFTPELAEQVLAGFRFLTPYYRYLRDLAGDPPPDHM